MRGVGAGVIVTGTRTRAATAVASSHVARVCRRSGSRGLRRGARLRRGACTSPAGENIILRAVLPPHLRIIAGALRLAAQIPPAHRDVILFVLVPVDHLLRTADALPLVVLAPHGGLGRGERARRGEGRRRGDATPEGGLVDILLATAVRDPAPLRRGGWSVGVATGGGVLLTAQVQPPAGHSGSAAGTSYNISRFHGVLENIVSLDIQYVGAYRERSALVPDSEDNQVLGGDVV